MPTIALFLLLFLFSDPAYSQTIAEIPGTRVALEVPFGFEIAPEFPGLKQASTGATITVKESQRSLNDISEEFQDANNLKKSDLAILEKTVLEPAGLLFRVQQKAYGRDFLQWIAMKGDENEAAVVIANFPAEYEAALSNTLKNVVVKAQWNKELIVPLKGERIK